MEQEWMDSPLTIRDNGDGTATVTNCEKDALCVEIPARARGLDVVEIADNAFEDCTALRELTFAEADEEQWLEGHRLSQIGGNAFMNCTALTSVTIPDSVAVIGWGAFYGCTALKEVCFSPLTYVSGYAFSHCTSLERVTPLSEVIEGTFSHCASLRQLPVTDRLTEIEDDAFEHCDGLTEICFPKTLRRIGDLAFRGCRGLKRVTFAETEGWFGTCRYDDSHEALDLTDPERNARLLAHVDFDDGPNGWYRK
ncbi:MAG: leucine-rich repeat domain-containing protein [Clostridia bacterium]|nr:leucine-rich repeat domain-containing protein [Clostridia bacterium]